jgi:hypothetical protein
VDGQLLTISFYRLFSNHYYWIFEYPQAGECKFGGDLEKTRPGVIRVEFHLERKDRRIECALSALTASDWFFRRHH